MSIISKDVEPYHITKRNITYIQNDNGKHHKLQLRTIPIPVLQLQMTPRNRCRKFEFVANFLCIVKVERLKSMHHYYLIQILITLYLFILLNCNSPQFSYRWNY